MDDKELKAYREAGKISSEVREWSRALIKEGANILEVAEKIEAKIREKGGELAFPANVCINDITAHYTPSFQDKTLIQAGDVISVDLGVHVDGFIADTAYTVDLSGNYGKMLETNEKALENAISLIKPGTSVSDIGAIVQKTITDAGYKPIENLTGHEVKQYDLHAGLSVPNIKVPYDWEVEEGMVLAIEPFATDGYGRVIESKKAEIFSLLEERPTRLREARTLLKEIGPRKELPFAERWFTKKISPLRLSLALRNLVQDGILKAYPVLHEKEKGIVSQFEHTVIVTEKGCEVTTE